MTIKIEHKEEYVDKKLEDEKFTLIVKPELEYEDDEQRIELSRNDLLDLKAELAKIEIK